MLFTFAEYFLQINFISLDALLRNSEQMMDYVICIRFPLYLCIYLVSFLRCNDRYRHSRTPHLCSRPRFGNFAGMLSISIDKANKIRTMGLSGSSLLSLSTQLSMDVKTDLLCYNYVERVKMQLCQRMNK